MTQPLSYYFLRYLSDSLRDANDALGREPGHPNGVIADDATSQERANHAALLGLTRGLENLENWAVELSVHLEREGVVELIREEP